MHRFSRSHVVILLCALTNPAATLAQERIVVGPSIMVSGSHAGWEHAEYAAHADPANASRVMVCVMRFSQARNLLTTVVYNSFDAGKQWHLALVDSSGRWDGVYDPACAYGPQGEAYFVTLPYPDTARADTTNYGRHRNWRMGGDEGMHFFRSPDGGRTWLPPIKLSFIDRPTLRVDNTKSPYRGRMYLHGNSNDSTLWIVYSADGGRTWTKSAETVIATPHKSTVHERGSTIQPDGTYLFPVQYLRTDTLTDQLTPAVVVSRDGGKTLQQPLVMANVKGCELLASDHSDGPFRGRLYGLCSSSHRNQVAYVLVNSDDNGQSWSRPVQVTRPRAARQRVANQRHPQIVVNRAGVVGVAWYDFGSEPQSEEGWLRFTASLDGGDTWLPSVAVSRIRLCVKNPPQFAAQAVARGGGRRRSPTRADSIDVWVWPSARSYCTWNAAPGDYSEMTAGADGAFHAFWISNATGVSELYTSRINVHGIVERSGAALAGLRNVTSALELQYTSSVWDPATSTLSLRYRVLNTSQDTVKAPLKLHIIKLDSDLGTPFLLLGNGRVGRAGTILDVTPALPMRGLGPSESTREVVLRIKLEDVTQLQAGYRDVVHLVIKAFSAGKRP